VLGTQGVSTAALSGVISHIPKTPSQYAKGAHDRLVGSRRAELDDLEAEESGCTYQDRYDVARSCRYMQAMGILSTVDKDVSCLV